MTLGLLMLALPDTYRVGMADAIRATVLRPVLAIQRGSADREGRFSDVASLRAERDSLATFLVSQSNMAAENRELRALLGFRPRLTYSFAGAEITRDPRPGSEGTLLLTAGSRDGIRNGSAIVTAAGLVGTVERVDANSAIGIDWTHPDFAVSAMTTDGETFGIAKPVVRENGERVLALPPDAFHTVPKTGSMIVTAGAGGMYPRGIPLGKVIGSGRQKDGWQRTYYIRPMVSQAQMSHVLVLGDPVKAPSDQDLASAWGIRLTGAPKGDSVARPVSPDAATPVAPAAARPAPRAARPAAERPRPAPRERGPRLLGKPVTRPAGTAPSPGGQTPDTSPIEERR